MTAKIDPAALTDEQLDAEQARRRQARWEESVAPKKAALQPLVDLGFGEEPIDTMIDALGNAMPAFLADDPALYQVLANARVALDGAQKNIAVRLRSLVAPPLV